MHSSLPCHTGFHRVFYDHVAGFLFIFLYFNIKTFLRIFTDIPDIYNFPYIIIIIKLYASLC